MTTQFLADEEGHSFSLEIKRICFAKCFEDHGRPIEINDFLKMVREYAAKKGWFEAVMLTFFA